jgi:hypothetical protein
VQVPFVTGHTSCQVALAKCRAKGVPGAVWFAVASVYVPPYKTCAVEPDIEVALTVPLQPPSPPVPR